MLNIQTVAVLIITSTRWSPSRNSSLPAATRNTLGEAALLIGDRLRQAVEDLSISVDDVTIRLTSA